MFYGIHLVPCCTYWRGSSACSAEHSIYINDTYAKLSNPRVAANGNVTIKLQCLLDNNIKTFVLHNV